MTPNPAVNSDVPIKVFVLVDVSGGTPVTWFRQAPKTLNVPIATLEAIAIDTQGARFPLIVSIGTPYQSGNDPATWFCPVAIDPLHRDLRDIAGIDALQALCLGIRLVIDLLRSFVARGGRLTYDGENDLPLDSYLFGPSNS